MMREHVGEERLGVSFAVLALLIQAVVGCVPPAPGVEPAGAAVKVAPSGTIEPVEIRPEGASEAMQPAAPASARSPAAADAGGGAPPLQPGIQDRETKAFVKHLQPNPAAGADGLERFSGWKAQGWGNAAEVSAWGKSGRLQDVVITVKLVGGAQDKVAIQRPVKLRLAATGRLGVDVFNSTDHAIPVSFAVFASRDRVYSESAASPAAPGVWTHLDSDLAAKTYKNAASDWKHSADIWGRDMVTELLLLFYDKGEGMIVVDRLTVDAEPADEEAAEPAPAPPGR